MEKQKEPSKETDTHSKSPRLHCLTIWLDETAKGNLTKEDFHEMITNLRKDSQASIGTEKEG